MPTPHPSLTVRSGLHAGEVTKYGTGWCPDTQRWKKVLDSAGVKYDYIDCDQIECPCYVKSFPALNFNDRIFINLG